MLIALALLLISLPAGSAEFSSKGQTSGTITIHGDNNEIEWDDDGVAAWDATGNVSVEFASNDGDIYLLTGDNLRYRRSILDGNLIYFVHLQGNVSFTHNEYSLQSDSLSGNLNPVALTASGSVRFVTEDIELTTELMSFIEIDEDVFRVEALHEATVLLTRDITESGPTEITPTGNSLPFPVDMNFDFKTISIAAPETILTLVDGEMTHSEFPYGIVGETDTDYLFSTGPLTIESDDVILGVNCRIVGPEAIIRASKMELFTTEKRVHLSEGASIISENGSLSMAGLTIVYDDHGICSLDAEGGIVLDFSLTLTDEDISLRPLVPGDLKNPDQDEES